MDKFRSSIVFLVLASFFLPQGLAAQSEGRHLVETDELRLSVAGSFSERQADIEEVRRMLSHDVVRSQLGSVADLEKIESRLSTLDDATLAQLADASREVNDDLQAGVSSWVIVIAAAAALLIILVLI